MSSSAARHSTPVPPAWVMPLQPECYDRRPLCPTERAALAVLVEAALARLLSPLHAVYALRRAVKRQLELPVASLKTSDDGDETEAPTVCVTLPSFLCAWSPVEALRVRALQGGRRAASFPSSIVHGWLTLSLREEMDHVKRHVTLRSCWRQAAGTREAAAAGLPPRGSCPAPSDRE